ncbi:hypothetical protein QTP86_012563 [Hemibagrus guttatus]|nr:hypothetical protein QTP86_012563 [Hemibagrus guttatus]
MLSDSEFNDYSGLKDMRVLEFVEQHGNGLLPTWMVTHIRYHGFCSDLSVSGGHFILDDCSSGLSLNAIRPLQMIQNAAARLVFNLPKFSHTTPLLRSLHWLPVAARIRFKTLMLAYKAKNGPTPSYLKALITPRTAPRSLRSTSTARLVPPSLREKAMFYLIGLGLGDAKDITVKGLEIIKRCSRVYLEAYTSILTVGKEALEEYYGRELILADRDMVEQEADEILKGADVSDVAFLVVGDPFGSPDCATTHSDLVLRAVNAGIEYRVIHNASILNAVGCCGLQIQEILSEKCCLKKSLNSDLSISYCLCYPDIKVKEQSMENLMRGRKVFEPPRFMSVAQAAEQLLEVVQNRRERGEEPAITEDTVCVGLARVGADDQAIRVGSLREMAVRDLGAPLHSMIITGHLHPLEVDMLRLFSSPEGLGSLKMTDGSTYIS